MKKFTNKIKTIWLKAKTAFAVLFTLDHIVIISVIISVNKDNLEKLYQGAPCDMEIRNVNIHEHLRNALIDKASNVISYADRIEAKAKLGSSIDHDEK